MSSWHVPDPRRIDISSRFKSFKRFPATFNFLWEKEGLEAEMFHSVLLTYVIWTKVGITSFTDFTNTITAVTTFLLNIFEYSFAISMVVGHCASYGGSTKLFATSNVAREPWRRNDFLQHAIAWNRKKTLHFEITWQS